MLTNEDIKALDWEKTGGLIPAARLHEPRGA